MKRIKRQLVGALALALALLIGCTAPVTPPAMPATEVQATRTITDMAGRTVEIPSDIHKVFGTDPVAATMLYTFDPALLLGWNYSLNEQELAYILPEYQTLPVLGMREKLNAEQVISMAPDICLHVGILDAPAIQAADALQAQLGIPVVMLDNALPLSAQAYTALGDIVGDAQRAATLCAQIRSIFSQIDGVQGVEKTAVYYGNGLDSLDTAPDGSSAAQVLALAQGDNVVKVDGVKDARLQISPEQLITFNPAVMFVNGEPKEGFGGMDAVNSILQNPAYLGIRAVQTGRVYYVPKAPFAWIDRPMGYNRLIGLLWVSKLLYPEQTDFDLQTEIRAFYEQFYHMKLTDQQLLELMGANSDTGV